MSHTDGERPALYEEGQRLRIGSRGSLLARCQTERVRAALETAVPGLKTRFVEIRTRGDREREQALHALGGAGLFVKELEEALRGGRIDLAVHSAKDLPGVIAPGLTIAAWTAREDPRDVWIARPGKRFDRLPKGARVGTSSLRRRMSILALRPDLEVINMRGNLDTRIAKLMAGEADLIVLAAAGLHRIGRKDLIGGYFSPEEMLPAPGQGALGLEVRAEDETAVRIAAALQDRRAATELAAERGFLATLAAGCQTPLAAHAVWSDAGDLRMRAWVGGLRSGRRLEAEAALPGAVSLAEAAALGRKLAEDLLSRGALELLSETEEALGGGSPDAAGAKGAGASQ